MSGARLRAAAGWIAAAALALGPIRVARGDLRSFASPGPLAEAHKGLDAACDRCHVPFQGVPNASCLGCHTKTAGRIAAGRGTHAGLGGQKCIACHKDHRGREHPLSPAVDERVFDHQVTGFPLVGRHQAPRCAQCHLGGRWAGLATACQSCHGDTHHRGALGGRCETCHTPRGWQPPQHTSAEHKLPMIGGHERLACARCHAGGSHLAKTSQCGDCHAQKHGGTSAPCDSCHVPTSWKAATFQHDFCTCILPGKHQSASCLSCHPSFVFRPTPLACAACHGRDRRHEDLGACARCHSALSWKKRVFDHDQQVPRFKLDGRHLEVGCENCHPRAGVFRGAPVACAGCHEVPAHGDFGPCAKCHTTRGFAGRLATFSHDATRFPLAGPHVEVTCQACHARFRIGQYVKGPNECALCHGDPHGGQFAPADKRGAEGGPALGRREPHARLAPTADAPAAGGSGTTGSGATGRAATAGGATGSGATGRECLDCHRRDRWVPSTVDGARHGGVFPLEGVHAGLACGRCHRGGAPGADHGRRFVGLPRTCAGCHFDAHGGRFGGDCASCHEPTRWRSTPGFHHERATGFALAGAHAGVSCAGCHGERRDRLDRVARPITCGACHVARHGPELGRDCARCHRPTRFADVPAFDHRERTDFPLERRHAALACVACHRADRKGAVNRACDSCHGDPHRGTASSDCADCHRADRWLLVRFDHDRTEFPLRGRHFVTACRQCHKNNQWTGVRSECVTCHALDRPAMRHPNRFECECCHRSSGWRPSASPSCQREGSGSRLRSWG